MPRLFFVLTLLYKIAIAHEIPVHLAITDAAVDYLASKDSRFSASSTKTRLKELLSVGTAREDDSYKGKWPLGRYYFHFTDSNGKGLNDGTSSAYCSSRQWGVTGAGSCVAWELLDLRSISDTNTHNWKAAIDNANTEEGWQHLGYVIHLLEDLSSPAHTRNDRHPHLTAPFTDTFIPAGDPDPVERYGVASCAFTCRGLPLIPPASWNLLTFSSAYDAFNRLQQWTSRNFYSSDTTEEAGPDIASLDSSYFYGDCLGNGYPCADPIKQRRQLKTYNVPFSGSIDKTIALQQLKELLPTAVQYVASLIKLYADVASPLIPGDGTVSVTTTLDGKAWVSSSTQPLIYTLIGPNGTVVANSSPASIAKLQPGLYTLQYHSGGPPNSSVSSIFPCVSASLCTKLLNPGRVLSFGLRFKNTTLNIPPTAGFSMTAAGVSPVTNGQTLNLTTPTGGTVSVMFDGSTPRSFDPDGTVTAWQWMIDGVSASGAILTRAFGLGTHNISLVVTDNSGTKSQAVQGAIVVFTAPIQGGSNWTQKNPANSPLSFDQHAMAYDAARGQVVLFGGFDDSTLLATRDTWTWDGNNWTQKNPANSPPSRGQHAMAYDAARGQVVLFGGTDGQGILRGDTWTWDGNNWTQKNPANSPSSRAQHTMAYDAARGQMVLFGGVTDITAAGVSRNDTWTWDGANWTQKNPTTRPSPRFSHDTSYDAARGQVVLFGGTDGQGILRGDTWTWDGINWTQKNPANSPSPRTLHKTAYDAARGQVVLFGGFDDSTLRFTKDTWTWDGINWTQKNPANSPFSAFYHAMAYDAARGQVVLTGYGFDGRAATWIWP